MKALLLICSLYIGSGFFLSTQPPTLNGVLWNDRSYEKMEAFPIGTDRSWEYDLKYELVPYCPTPGKQEGQASCSGWAIANAMTIRWAIQCKQTDQFWIDAHQFSPAFIYNQAKAGKNCSSGAYLSKALEIGREYGVCFQKTMPYDPNVCDALPGARQKEEAARYKITRAYRLYSVKDAPQKRVENTIWAVAQNNPVIVALMITPDFKSQPEGAAKWTPGREARLGGDVEGHAVVVVGYDQQARVFTMLNNYGAQWADCGFFEMSFDDFQSQARYGIVISIGPKKCD